MRSSNLLLAVAHATSLLAGAVNAVPYVVDERNNVAYQGVSTTNGVDTFLNIRFGKDTGLNRFGPPVAFTPTANSTLNNTAAGAACPQPTAAGSAYNSVVENISEDCLNLKVARPSFATKDSKLPVMVYIYGGGLFNGQIYERTAAPDGLIQQSAENGLPVVYVAMNYRLNIFGFAVSDSLRDEKSLNVGLRDQRLALEWVRDNIEIFGGDPNKVTIFGQSSGALSVTLQVLAYGGTQGAPFHGAIMESTVLEATMTSNLTIETYNDVAELAGCVSSDLQSDKTLACLRGLSMAELLNITITQHDSTSTVNDGDIYLPVVDGDFLPVAPSELIRTGNFSKMPIMSGWVENDATLFTSTSIETPEDTVDFFELYYKGLTNQTLSRLLSLYPVGDFSANPSANLSAEFYRSAQIFRDILLTCPAFYFGHAMAQKCTPINSTVNSWNKTAYSEDSFCPGVYLYVHNQTILDPYLASVGQPGLGVIHTSDLAYVFGDLSLYNTSAATYQPTESDYALVARESRSWSTFASVGQPSLRNKDTLQGWETAYESGREMMDARIYVIGGSNEGISELEGKGAMSVVAKEKLRERCGFLNSAEVILQLQY